jgi:hypothetical protein
MEYRKSFKECLNKVANYDATKFIGTGNPNADILIISKELELSDEEQIKREITNNHYNWVNNLKVDADTIGEYPAATYNPMFPYKGKLLKTERGGHTWRKYQKLSDLINNQNIKKADDKFDFHNSFFLTKINSSIEETTLKRKRMISELEFFNEFKVIIIDGLSSYILKKKEDEPTNEIEHRFSVYYNRMAEPVANQRFWIFKSGDGKRMVIQTGKLNGKNLAEEYLKELSEVIKDFIQEQE